MRYAATLFDGDLRRSDLNVAVNLDRVTIHDLAAEAQSQLDSQFALPGSSGANDRNDGRSLDRLISFV